jgi:hypothetical protein
MNYSGMTLYKIWKKNKIDPNMIDPLFEEVIGKIIDYSDVSKN